jgi:hypothetical protein
MPESRIWLLARATKYADHPLYATDFAKDIGVSDGLSTRLLQLLSSPIHAHGLVALAAFVGC